MDFFQKFSKNSRAADKASRPIVGKRNYPQTPQLEVPPKAYTYRNGSIDTDECESLLHECKTLPTTGDLSINTPPQERVSMNGSVSLSKSSCCRERGCHEKAAELEKANNKLRMENARLKTSLKGESSKHAETLKYWIQAEKELGESLKACQIRHGRFGGNTIYEEGNNAEGNKEDNIVDESEGVEEVNFATAIRSWQESLP